MVEVEPRLLRMEVLRVRGTEALERLAGEVGLVHLHIGAPEEQQHLWLEVLAHDVLLLSAVFYPLTVAGVQPLALLLMTGWQDALGIEKHWWNLVCLNWPAFPV